MQVQSFIKARSKSGYSSDFILAHENIPLIDGVRKKLYCGSMEITFLPFYKQLVLQEPYKNPPDISGMLFFGRGVDDDDAIDVHDDELSNHIPEDIIYEALEHCELAR